MEAGAARLARAFPAARNARAAGGRFAEDANCGTVAGRGRARIARRQGPASRTCFAGVTPVEARPETRADGPGAARVRVRVWMTGRTGPAGARRAMAPVAGATPEGPRLVAARNAGLPPLAGTMTAGADGPLPVRRA